MNMTLDKLWLKTTSVQIKADWNLICFPPLCGFAEYFLPWQSLLTDGRLYAVQLPGRASRHKEDHITDVNNLLNCLLPVIVPIMEQKPCVLFGHSMGGHLAYRVAYELHKLNIRVPILLTVSGAAAPIRFSQRKITEASLREGIETEFAKKNIYSPLDLMYLNMLNHSIREDCLLLNSCALITKQHLNVPILFLVGSDDPHANSENIDEWRAETTANFSYHLFKGDHFTIDKEIIISKIKQEILQIF